MREWPNAWRLYGHAHGKFDRNPLGLSLDVGVDSHAFTPVTLDRVAEMMRARAQGRLKRDAIGSDRPGHWPVDGVRPGSPDPSRGGDHSGEPKGLTANPKPASRGALLLRPVFSRIRRLFCGGQPPDRRAVSLIIPDNGQKTGEPSPASARNGPPYFPVPRKNRGKRAENREKANRARGLSELPRRPAPVGGGSKPAPIMIALNRKMRWIFRKLFWGMTRSG